MTFTRADGAVVTVWPATCGVCGFVSGLARVVRSGRSIEITGAGCRERRDVAAARKWAEGVQL